MTQLYKLFIAATLIVSFITSVVAQATIDWQKSIGTPNLDAALKIFNDEEGNIVIIGTEAHEDITGTLRDYVMVSKIDAEGNEIWKKYHDIGYETNSIAFYYYFGDHFYTDQSGQKIINLVADLSGKLILYKIYDENGAYYSYDNLTSPHITIDSDNVKITASTRCSVQPSCYGPDSLIIQKINPIPDSNFNVIEWTFGLKQNIRTSAISGHYDFNVNDIATDEEGNVYALVQIQRWEFQFCTDCNDAFIDAHNMLFKWSADGELISYERLNITTAEVSHTGFLSVADGNIVVRINDINNAGTAILTSIYRTDYDLDVKGSYSLDRNYNYMLTDDLLNLYAVTNVYDPADPNIKGASDVIVTKFNNEGQLQWKSYYGGTSFDFPKGLALTGEDGIVFFANTESEDFDVEENHGYQDMWLVSLSESTTSSEDADENEFYYYPNPVVEVIHFNISVVSVDVFDLSGKIMLSKALDETDREFSVKSLPSGAYVLRVEDAEGVRHVSRMVKL